MRKVVTGEQVARLSNPDPFALPGLARPGLPDPGLGCHPAAQLARLLGRLVRLAARHPLAAGILALMAVLWLDLGWVTLVALAACGHRDAGGLAVVLAGHLRPLGHPSLPGGRGGAGSTGAAGPG